MIKSNVCYVPLGKRLRELVVQSVRIVVLADMVMVAKNVKLGSIEHLLLVIPRHVLHAVLDDTNPMLGKQAAFYVHQENTNISKEHKHVRTVKLDVRPTLLVTIKANVCCVPSVKRLHELAVQSVKIVVQASMVKGVKCAKLGSIERLLLKIQQRV
jgi:hypothetical protein